MIGSSGPQVVGPYGYEGHYDLNRDLILRSQGKTGLRSL